MAAIVAKRGINGEEVGTKAETKTSDAHFLREEDIIEAKLKDVEGRVVVQKYVKGKLLGKGGFAKCYHGISLPSKTACALKIVLKTSLVKTRAKHKLQSEIKIHRLLKHRNVCRFERFFEDRLNAYMVLELCSNNSMSELIKRRKTLTAPEVRFYTTQLLSALKYLHHNCVIHRDLKLGNLFLDSSLHVKVGDFGLATKLCNREERKKTMCGTPNYIAPEILDGKMGHSFEVDIWSTGVIIYTLLIGKPPFESKDVKSTYKMILANQYSFPSHLSVENEGKKIIQDILQTLPERRPSLECISEHIFYRGFTPQDLPPFSLREAPSITQIQRHISNTNVDTGGGDENDSSVANSCFQRQSRDDIYLTKRGTQNKTVDSQVDIHAKFEIMHPAPVRFGKETKSTADIPITLGRWNDTDDSRKFDVFVDTKNIASKFEDGISNCISKALKETNVANDISKEDYCSNLYESNNNRDKNDLSNNHIDHLRVGLDKLHLIGKENDRQMELTGKEGVKLVVKQQISQSPTCANVTRAEKAVGTLECMHKTLCQNVGNYKKNKLCREGKVLSESKMSSLVAKVWVVKYVDYTSKYGLGFLLNTGCVGVYFNDSTKIVVSADGRNFSYIERRCKVSQGSAEHIVENFSMSSYPLELQKKVTLLNHFKNYLCDPKDEETVGAKNTILSQDDKEDKSGSHSLPFLKKWVRTRHAILFRLSTKTVQVVFFDKSEILLSSDAKIVTFVNKIGIRSEHTLNDVLSTERADIAKRLKYTKDILYRLINLQHK